MNVRFYKRSPHFAPGESKNCFPCKLLDTETSEVANHILNQLFYCYSDCVHIAAILYVSEKRNHPPLKFGGQQVENQEASPHPQMWYLFC